LRGGNASALTRRTPPPSRHTCASGSSQRAPCCIGSTRRESPTFLRRLAWRDLAIWSLWRFPTLPDRPFRPWFEEQEWAAEGESLNAWRAGRTGYPLVDAAMAQLWHAGWMPNYMRHVVAGFLVEYLSLDWRHGERWFDYTLVDADTAINAYMWQNGGHSGMDQWNFVMHPVYAAKSCDPDGDYVRRWLPQLARLPTEYIHCPWEAPYALRAAARVVLGDNYPHRGLTDLDAARRRSHAAVMAVRRGPGASQVLPSGHEWLALEGGHKVTLITRCDYREGTVTREGTYITGDDVVTRQTAEAKWDVRRRERTDDLSLAMRDSMRQAGGGGDGEDGGAAGGGKGRGRGRGRGGGRGPPRVQGAQRGVFTQPKPWG